MCVPVPTDGRSCHTPGEWLTPGRCLNTCHICHKSIQLICTLCSFSFKRAEENGCLYRAAPVFSTQPMSCLLLITRNYPHLSSSPYWHALTVFAVPIERIEGHRDRFGWFINIARPPAAVPWSFRAKSTTNLSAGLAMRHLCADERRERGPVRAGGKRGPLVAQKMVLILRVCARSIEWCYRRTSSGREWGCTGVSRRLEFTRTDVQTQKKRPIRRRACTHMLSVSSRAHVDTPGFLKGKEVLGSICWIQLSRASRTGNTWAIGVEWVDWVPVVHSDEWTVLCKISCGIYRSSFRVQL